jgi:hypothetical protein
MREDGSTAHDLGWADSAKEICVECAPVLNAAWGMSNKWVRCPTAEPFFLQAAINIIYNDQYPV